MGSISLDQQEMITIGKHAKGLASPPSTLWWIGSVSAPSAQQAKRAAVGRRFRIDEVTRW